MQETNNPVEVTNHQVKEFNPKDANASLADSLSSILTMIKSVELNKIVLASNQTNKTVVLQNSITDPVVNEFFKIVGSKMAHWLNEQYNASKTREYSITDKENSNDLIVKINEKSYTISNVALDSASCTCYENLSLNLPCRHIFFARASNSLQIFNSNMVPDRHKITNELKQVENPRVNMIKSIPDFNDVASLITSKKMDQKAKYSAAFRLGQEIANSLKSMKQQDFERYLSKLLKAKEFIDNKVDFNVVAVMEEISSGPNDGVEGVNNSTLVDSTLVQETQTVQAVQTLSCSNNEIQDAGNTADADDAEIIPSSQTSQISNASNYSSISSSSTFQYNITKKSLVQGL